MHNKLTDLYNAVIADNGMEVQKILSDDLLAKTRISTKIITGILIIAIENRLINAGKAILTHNTHAKEKIADTNLNAIMRLATKSHLLGQFKVTYH